MEIPPKFFNTTGPCDPERHYMLPPADRLVSASLDRYISHQLYWVLHAPRQTGKTTFLQSWMHEINGSGQGVACYVSVERCQQFPDADEALPLVCDSILSYARSFLDEALVPSLTDTNPGSMLDSLLTQWAAQVAPKPLILLFDEVDVLEDQAMVSFLRQLRGGFVRRGVGKFPVSVALVGMRDLRDYLIQSKDGVPLNPGSPFNIKEDSASLSNFAREDVRALAQQHTSETGQQFSSAAMDLIYDYGRGQPWLTNALFKICTWDLCAKGETIEEAHIREAKELLIQKRAVHLDSLAVRLREPRIKHIVQTIMVGEMDPDLTTGDDFVLAMDLGLVTMEGGTAAIANPIYREVIARVLSQGYQDAIPQPEFPWKRSDGTLATDRLLKEFQKFWRRHGDIWEAKADYSEAFPHLLLMGFLQRVVNGGGRVEREYAAGRGRMDLAVLYGGSWSIIEIKLVHPQDGRATTVEEGVRQTLGYRNTIDSSAECYLVVFDRTPAGREKSWEERLSWEEVNGDEGVVTVVGG